MVFYFSGTGNSLWVARTLAHKLGDEVASLVDYWDEDFWRCDDEVVGFVMPTYMNDVPWLVKRVLENLELTHPRFCYAVMTSSHGKSGQAFTSMDMVLQQAGGRLHAGYDVQMPGNCLVSTKEENEERLAAAPVAVAVVADAVKRETCTWRSRAALPPEDFVESSYFYGTHSLRRLTYMKGFEITDACTGCGLCGRLCPTCNIDMVDGRAVHGDVCAACYACLHWCPEQATRLKVSFLKDKRFQYHHPDVTAEDLLYE